MHQLYIDTSIPRPLLMAAHHATGNLGDTKTFNYYIFGYFDSCHYNFVFFVDDDNTEQVLDTLGIFLS